MSKKRTNLWIGFTIGILAALLATTLAILFIPRLRPIIGLNSTNLVNTQNEPNNTAANNEVNDLLDRPTVLTESDNISVTSPAPYEEVSNPFEVTGSARVFENQVSVRLLDGDGTVLAETYATARATDIGLFGPYEVTVSYRQNKYNYGTLEVYQASAKDGSEVDKVTIPVTFAEGAGV